MIWTQRFLTIASLWNFLSQKMSHSSLRESLSRPGIGSCSQTGGTASISAVRERESLSPSNPIPSWNSGEKNEPPRHQHKERAVVGRNAVHWRQFTNPRFPRSSVLGSFGIHNFLFLKRFMCAYSCPYNETENIVVARPTASICVLKIFSLRLRVSAVCFSVAPNCRVKSLGPGWFVILCFCLLPLVLFLTACGRSGPPC